MTSADLSIDTRRSEANAETIRPVRIRWLRPAAGFVACAVAAFVLAWLVSGAGRPLGSFLIAMIGLGLSAAGLLLYVAMLLDHGSLYLCDDALVVQGTTRWVYAWNGCSEFQPVSRFAGLLAGVSFRYRKPGQQKTSSRTVMLFDVYPLSTERLAKRLNECRAVTQR